MSLKRYLFAATVVTALLGTGHRNNDDLCKDLGETYKLFQAETLYQLKDKGEEVEAVIYACRNERGEVKGAKVLHKGFGIDRVVANLEGQDAQELVDKVWRENQPRNFILIQRISRIGK